MNTLINELKNDIIEQLNMQDISISDIDDKAPLFGEGLGLDSIDALELIVLLQKKYKVKVNNADEGKEVFKSVRSIAEFIQSKQPVNL